MRKWLSKKRQIVFYRHSNPGSVKIFNTHQLLLDWNKPLICDVEYLKYKGWHQKQRRSISLYKPKYVNIGPMFKYRNFSLTVEEEWRGRTGRRHGNVTFMWFVCFFLGQSFPEEDDFWFFFFFFFLSIVSAILKLYSLLIKLWITQVKCLCFSFPVLSIK